MFRLCQQSPEPWTDYLQHTRHPSKDGDGTSDICVGLVSPNKQITSLTQNMEANRERCLRNASFM